MIRILVFDDHDATRRSLSSFLAHEDKFTIAIATGEKSESRRHRDDVSMPKKDGLSAARIIHRENPSTSGESPYALLPHRQLREL